VRLLKRACDAAAAGGEIEAFEARLVALRERHRRRPSLIAMWEGIGAQAGVLSGRWRWSHIA
jgi:hypothetical protein